MQLHLHAYSKTHDYEDCGPVDTDDACFARALAVQNKERLESCYGGEWTVELENHGRHMFHVGFRRRFCLEVD